jgi:hypothetical protein
VTLPPLNPCRLALLAGSVEISYGNGVLGTVQVYGIDRFTFTDASGGFTLAVPQGKQRFHIGAGGDSSGHSPGEYDGIDVTIDVFSGETRDAGSFRLRPPPPTPCADGSCDSAVVRMLLDRTGNRSVGLSSVTAVDSGRIVELNLRGLNLSGGIPFDINRLARLRVLDLGQTGLAGFFPDIGRMSALEIVRLDGNHLPYFSSTIGRLVNLRELDLSGNELTALPLSITSCPRLTSLNVAGNRLCLVDPPFAAWIDRLDAAWRANQRCE